MPAKIKLTQAAEQDICEIIDWYRQKSPSMVLEFFQALEKHYQRLKANPEMFQRVNKKQRRLFFSRFPYSMYYEIQKNEEIIILAVYHVSRDPKKWNNPN